MERATDISPRNEPHERNWRDHERGSAAFEDMTSPGRISLMDRMGGGGGMGGSAHNRLFDSEHERGAAEDFHHRSHRHQQVPVDNHRRNMPLDLSPSVSERQLHIQREMLGAGRGGVDSLTWRGQRQALPQSVWGQRGLPARGEVGMTGIRNPAVSLVYPMEQGLRPAHMQARLMDLQFQEAMDLRHRTPADDFRGMPPAHFPRGFPPDRRPF
jgi:hypothetical protein